MNGDVNMIKQIGKTIIKVKLEDERFELPEEIERKISDIESTEVYKILDKEKILLVKQDTKKEIKAIVVEQMLDKMLDLDEDMTEEQLRQLVAEKYEVIKYKKMAVLQDIQKILKKYFDQYQDMVEMKGN